MKSSPYKLFFTNHRKHGSALAVMVLGSIAVRKKTIGMAAGADACRIDMRIGHACAAKQHAVDLDKITVRLAVLHLYKARVHDLPAAKTVKFVHAIRIHLKAALSNARSDGGIDFGITA